MCILKNQCHDIGYGAAMAYFFILFFHIRYLFVSLQAISIKSETPEMNKKITILSLCFALSVCLSTYADERPSRVGDKLTAPLKSVGSPRVPVVLVAFSDLSFSVAESDEQIHLFFDLFCNGTRDGNLYKDAGSYGSVRDYFAEQSDSIFTPEFIVIGPVVLSDSYAYYGRNSGSAKDVNIRSFYTEALALAQDLYPNWNDFDNDGDGTVDMAYFIYAGEGENGSSDTNTIWPKEMQTPISINGLRFACYACCNETYKGECDGIGVMCHELSHALGLPDFYDTNYVAYGLDYWDLMDSGCYCLGSYHPCGYSAYERDFMGWRRLQVLTRDKLQHITLYPMSEGGVGYKIVNPENQNEYYVIENRQNTGWDAYIGRGSANVKRHGLIVSHIDYLRSRWTSNSVNTDPKHQYYTIIPADGSLYSYMDVATQDQYNRWSQSASSDPFPGLGSVAALLSDKQPIYTSAGSMRQPLTAITEHTDGSITLTICDFADVNGDGEADTQDVLNVYDYIQSGAEMKPGQPHDVNADLNIDTQDVLQIYESMQNF